MLVGIVLREYTQGPHIGRPLGRRIGGFLIHPLEASLLFSRENCRLGVGRSRLLRLGLLLAAFAVEANASGVILNTGFESPYSLGPLQGQFGWLTAGTGASTATVQNSIVHSGSQAVQVVKAGTPNSDRRWATPVTGYPTQRFVIVDWDMRVAPTNHPTAFGPFIGVDTYDADVQPYVLGSLGVDATTGDVLYQIQDTAVLTETGLVINFDQWYHYRLVLDFLTDTYQGYVNGTLVANTGFPDRGFGLNNFTDADIAAFAAAADPASQSLSASAVFDNFLVRDGIPGDYDIDGDVDTADYAQWQATFGDPISPAGNLADGSGNGLVDAADFVTWRKNLGSSLVSGSGAGSAVVPEPMTLLSWLPIASLVGLTRLRHRRDAPR